MRPLLSTRGASAIIGIVVLVTTSFVAAIILGELEPTMLGTRDSDTSADANTTIGNVSSYGWSGMNLAILGAIVMGAAVVLRYIGLLG